MKVEKIKLIVSVLAILILTGCKKEEIIFFNGNASANFWDHEYGHSFFGVDEHVISADTLVFKIAIVGPIANYERKVMAAAVPDPKGTDSVNRFTTATPDQYEILGGTIPADSLYGNFKVVVKNSTYLSTPKTELRLKIRMIETKDMKVGLVENNYINIKWSREVLRPVTWRAMRFFFCSTYSTAVYRLVIQTTGLKQFYYYEGIVSVDEAYVLGRKFGDLVRKLSAEQGSPILHDDGEKAGLPIDPIY